MKYRWNKYHRHIKNLCRHHKIDLFVDCTKKVSWFSSSAVLNQYDRSIHIASLEGENVIPTYAAALHEIGHILNKYNIKRLSYAFRRGITTKGILINEIKAWKTARKIAKHWNDQMTRLMCFAISRYIYSYNCDHPKRTISDMEYVKALGIKCKSL